MNQIILASHGGMSAGLKDTMELILGAQPNVYPVATTRDETEPITAAVRRLLGSFPKEDRVYILTDVLGGSVNNDMLSLLPEYPEITIICGCNVGLALLLANSEDDLSDEELEAFLQEARDQIINCSRQIKTIALEEDDL